MKDISTRPIGFFDSGVGGLPYLELTRKYAPGERFVYLADRKNFPYGEKTPVEIRKAVFSGIEMLIERENPKLIVVACNTASVVSLQELRDRFRIPFVGVVPAVKPAAKKNRNGKIAILATKRTLEEDYLENLIESFAKNREILKYPESELVKLVEYEYFQMKRGQWKRVLLKIGKKLKAGQVETVVLGCTHFTLLADLLKNEFDGIEIIDSRDGVSRQVLRVLRENDLLTMGSVNEDKENNYFYVTGDAPFEERYRLFAEKYDLQFNGNIEGR